MTYKPHELGPYCEHGLPRKFCTSAEHLSWLDRLHNTWTEPFVIFFGCSVVLVAIVVVIAVLVG